MSFIRNRIVIEKRKNKKYKGHTYLLRCNFCNKEFVITGKAFNLGYGTYCSTSCANKGCRRGYSGKAKIKGGYVGLTRYDANGQRSYYPEHRYIIEQIIGRKLLKNEHVHHIDKNRSNNNINNLLLLSASEHQKIHHRKTSLSVQCCNCGKIIIKNLYVLSKFKNVYCSKHCYIEHRFYKNAPKKGKTK